MRRFRPGYGVSPETRTLAIEQTLRVNDLIRKAKSSLAWGLVNVCLLGCILYDLTYKCPLYTTFFNYIEYGLICVFSLNTVYHIFRYFHLTFYTEPVIGTPVQRSLLGFKESDPYYRTQSNSTPQVSPYTYFKTPDTSLQNTPLNMTANSWRSNSPNDSQNYSLSSPSWVYYRGSPESQSFNTTPPAPARIPDISGVDYITDEKTLKQYLNDYENYEKSMNATNTNEQPSNLLSTFWSHPATQSPNEVSMYLKKGQYQLALTNSSTAANNPSGKTDEGSPLNISQQGHDVWRRFQIDPLTLTQWNANLRMWICQTIFERVVNEINIINNEFQNHHLTDVRIGYVGLERLRKTAQTAQVAQHIPTLSALMPFLEMSTNQEYLVRRIRQLAQGGCMSEFRWNSGGNFNEKQWDDTLLTDSAIVMHMLSTYLDSQLLPLPNKPDAKPFSKQHYIKLNEKIPQSPFTLAVQQVSDKPPHFRVIAGEEVLEVAKGHNNLFHTILLFLYYVHKKEHGMLGKVNMGKSGVNMLWIIDT